MEKAIVNEIMRKKDANTKAESRTNWFLVSLKYGLDAWAPCLFVILLLWDKEQVVNNIYIIVMEERYKFTTYDYQFIIFSYNVSYLVFVIL